MRKEIKNMSKYELRRFIPNIYQRSIYDINYIDLYYNHNIRVITFDLDDTITDLISWIIPNKAKRLFNYLIKLGIKPVILSNASERRVKYFAKKLNADWYRFKVHKPETSESWNEVLKHYNISREQLLHIGNNICDDVYGAHKAYIKVALVRRNGLSMKLCKGLKTLIRFKGTHSHDICKRLKEEKLFYKYKISKKNDQYYQLT